MALIKAIKTPFNKRNPTIITTIMQFIETTKIGQNILKKENLSSGNSKTLTDLSIYLQYQHFNAGDNIFKIGKFS